MSNSDDSDALPVFNDVNATKRQCVSISSTDSEPLHPPAHPQREAPADTESDEDERPKPFSTSLAAYLSLTADEEQQVLPDMVLPNRISEAPVARVAAVRPPAERLATAVAFNGALPLDKGSLLCLPSGATIGSIALLFGPVNQPVYAIRLREGASESLSDGAELHYDVSSANILFDLAGQCDVARGTDASYVDDDELPENVRPDFSDDEEEKQWKRTRAALHQAVSGELVSSDDEPPAVAWTELEWDEVVK